MIMTAEEIKHSSRHLGVVLSIIRTIEAERRTHLAELRTGIGILTIPLSLLTILIAFSDYYNIEAVFFFIVGLVIGIIVLGVIGGYLVIRAFVRIRRIAKLRHDAGLDTAQIVRNYNTES